jgi:hypothetical protein
LGALGCALRLVHGVSRTEGHAPVATPQQSSPSRRWSSLAGWSLAGALGALSAYAYHTGRLAPLVLAALVALRLGGDRVAWRRAAPGLVVAALTGLLVLVPLLRFVAGDFAGYNRRTAAVAFYTNEDAGVHAPLLLLLRNAERYLLMWHVAGDANGRHHAPGAPMVDVVTGTLLLVGLALAARGDSRARLVLVWVGLGLVPGLLSTGAPHAMRGLPALAPACALAGLGLAWLTRDREPDPRSTASRRRRLLLALLSLVLAASLALNLNLYFHQMTRDPQVEGAFDVPETAMGRLVHAHTAAPELQHVRVFLPAGVRESEVVRFLGAGAQPGYFDVDEGLSAPPGAQALLLLPAEASVDVRAAAVAALGPGARELDAPRSADGRPLLVVYGVGQGAEEFLRVAFDRR